MKAKLESYLDDPSKEKFYSYPAHKVLGVFDTPESVKETFDELKQNGFHESDAEVFCSAGQIDFSGEEDKLWGRIVHSIEHLGLSGEFLKRFEKDLEESHLILAVSAKDQEAKEKAREVMQSHEGHRLTFFGNWVVEEMPEANRIPFASESYGFIRKFDVPYEQSVKRVRDSLQVEGFGVLTEIDMKAKLKEKLGEDFRNYVILGACNPKLAFSALQEDLEIGLLLPCNVIVYETDGGSVVAAIDAKKMLSVTGNRNLEATAETVNQKLRRAIESV